LVAALRTKVDALAQTPGSLAQQRLIYLARTPSGGGVLASAYFDQGMHNRTGEKIGSISDLIVASDGTIAAALVGVGGFLGIGEKEVAVPFSSIEVVRNANDLRFVIDATKEALKEAPSFEDTAARVHLRPTPSTNR
jgi:sporulation protein YlmC with PRC-barrel domain